MIKTEFRIIRHGPKYPATHPDKSVANCLTEEGRKAAYEYGRNAKNEGYQNLHIFSSGADRAKQTAAYISAGFHDHSSFHDSSSIEAFVQTYPALVEPELEQMEPESPFIPYYAKLCTRKEAIEKCYGMLRADVDPSIDKNEKEIMETGASRYLSMIEKYVRKQEDIEKNELHLFIGHDPNIGGLQQKLQSEVFIPELSPLEGITFRLLDDSIQYLFLVGNDTYSGFTYQLEIKQRERKTEIKKEVSNPT